MKKHLLFIICFIGLLGMANAQPANDICTGAINLGTLGNPGGCGTGVVNGAVNNTATTNVGATPENPYVTLAGCGMATPANSVWYRFVAPANGYGVNIAVTGGGGALANPNIALWSGNNCANLAGVSCIVGAGGSATLNVPSGIVPGQTYYIQISGNTGQSGTFNLAVNAFRDCSDCLTASHLTVSPLPVNGTYQPGQTVSFCYHIDNWVQVANNWLHGVQMSFGPGWNMATLTTSTPPGGNYLLGCGGWSYFPAGIGVVNGTNWGPGFYFDYDVNIFGGCAGAQGDPWDNFGDGTDNDGGVYTPPANEWNFCWTIQVSTNCTPNMGLGVTVTTSADGESGSWTSVGCLDDPPTTFNAVIACCPPIMTMTPVTCFGGSNGTATATVVPGSTAPYDFQWAGPGAYSSSTMNTASTSNTISGLLAGVYTVTFTDANNCSQTATVNVTQPAAIVVTAANTGPYCAGATIQLNGGAGYVDYDWTGPGPWSQNNTQNPTRPTSTVAMSGVYTVIATNAAGCTTSATTTVTVNSLPTPSATNTGPYCAGATIQLNSVGGAATDDWAGPGPWTLNNTQNPTRPTSTVAMSGVYTVTATNGFGCSATSTTTVVVNPLPTPTANNTGPYCAGATIQLNSPTGSATDDWAGPGPWTQNDTQNPTRPTSTVAMSGVYTVTVTDIYGCSATATTTVTVNPIPVPTANNTGPYCAGATIQLNSPTGSATDDWAGPGPWTQNNTQNPTRPTSTVAMSGVYTVTVTTAAGCSATATTTATVNPLPTPTANNTGPYCAGATIQLNSPTGSATDDWAGPGGWTQANLQNPTRPTSTPSMSGVYTVTVTDANGCSATATTTVTVNALPTPTANNTGPYCEGATIQLNSPTGSATDDWAGPGGWTQANTQNPTRPTSTPAMSGVYTVTVTDINGCSATATTTVTVNPLPVPTASNTGPYCAGTTIQLNSPTGSATDDWAGPGPWTQNDTQNPTRPTSTVAMSGVYTVTVTTAAGCSATATTTVTVNPLPVPTANNTGPYCAGATIQLNSPTGSATDDWSGPGGWTQANLQNPTRPTSTPAMSGVYTVTVTDVNGCSATATTTVTVNALPTPTANNTGPYCEGTTIQLNSPTGSATDDWTGPGGWTQANAQNPTRPTSTVAMSGVYTVTVTDINGCSATATTTVTVNPLPVPTANNTGPYCFGQTIQLNSPTGSATDDWAGPSFTATNQQNPTIPGAIAAMNGVYTVTVTNASGCSATATTTVLVNASLNPVVGNTGPYCVGATINLTSAGGIDYDWTGPNAYVQNNTQNPTIASSALINAGIYTVTVTDASGCSGTGTTTVTVNTLPTPTANNTGPYCAGTAIQLNSPTGSATDDWAGPGAWSQNNLQNPTRPTSTPAMSGIYTVTVTDVNGCSATATTTVTVNSLPTPTAYNTGPYCAGTTIQLNSPTGSGSDDWAGPGGYTAVNTQNPTRPTSTPAMSGVYTVTVTDINGCSATATTSVTVNALPTPTANNTGPYCVGSTIQLNSPTGSATDDWTGPLAYAVNNVQNPTRPTATLAMAGLYTVTVTDINGCSATATTTVTVNALPTPTANNTGPYCAGTTIQLNSPTGSGTDDWAGPGGWTQNNLQNPTRPTSTPAMSGIYTVTVTDVNGCSATATTTVTVNALPIPTANNTGPYCAGATIQLNSPTGSGSDDWAGPGAYTSINTQNPTRPTSTPAMGGIYTVTVTDINGCSATATTSVTVNALPTPTSNNTGPYCVGTTIQLNSPTGSGTDDWTGPSAYAVNNIQNPNIGSAALSMAGVYTVSVTDINGCSATATTTVSINALPTPTANNTGPYCAGVTIQLNSPTGSGTDDWSGPGAYVATNDQNPTRPTSTPAMSGIYTVTVTDANGCSATATTTVTVNALPNPTANNTGPYCIGSTIQLNSPTGSGTDDWTGPLAYNAMDVQNPTIGGATLAMSGSYIVTVTDGNGCTGTASTNVTVNPLPTPTASNTGPYCVGATIQLNSPTGSATDDWTGPLAYSIANNQNPTIGGATAGMGGDYTVTVTDANGCTGSATTTVVIYNNPVAAFLGDNLFGCAPVCVNFSDQSNANGSVITSWNWTVEGQAPGVTQNVAYCFNNPGLYDVSLTVTTTEGCTATSTIVDYVNVYANPVASFMFTPQEIIETDPEVTFASTSTGATSWSWDFGDGTTSLVENPIHLYQDTGTFCISLLVSNNAGCTDTTIGCLYIQPDFSLFIPNAFTVNDDGLNEQFMVYGRGIKTITVRIFDRWGEELYYFDDINKGWPGIRQNGQPCKQDVYVYRIEVVDGGNDFHEFMGRVTLIR